MLSRGGALSLLALWAWLLYRDHRHQLAARLALLMIAGIASYLIVSAGQPGRPSPAGLVLAVIAGSTPGLFWLFARAWFNDEARISRVGILLVAAAAANILLLQLTFAQKPPIFYVSATLFRVAMLAFAAAGLWEAWRGREGDLVETRRRLRTGIITAVGAYVVLIAAAEIAVYQANAPHWMIVAVVASIVFVTLAFCAAMFATREPDLFGAPPARVAPLPEPDIDDPLATRLLAHMERERAYRDEGLTIAALAQQLGGQEYRLRRLINGRLGHRNFAAFLNGYRLAEVKAALADAGQADVPILTIALDAGFGSLGPFNRAFREAEGMTPSEFRAQAAKKSPADQPPG